jgi:hypothetical protein
MEAKGWVILAAPASADVYVGLYPSNAQLVEYPFPPGTKVSAGQTVGNFTFRPKPVTAPTQLAVTARIGQQPESKTINYTIQPPVLGNMVLNVAEVVGGNPVQGTATFSGPPAVAGTIWAKLSSSNPSVATVPEKTVLEAGKIVASFEVKTVGVPGYIPVTISASTGSTYPTTGNLNPHRTLKVWPASLKEFGRIPTPNSSLQVVLDGSPPPQGAVVSLSSAEPNVATIPSSVTIPAGSNSAVVNVTEYPKTSHQNVWLTAKYAGKEKKWKEFVWCQVKPDLDITTVSLRDRFGNPITKPADSQGFQLCAEIKNREPDICRVAKPPVSLLRVEYRRPGTNVGRSMDLPVDFSYPGSPGAVYLAVTPCTGKTDMPGLEVGQYYDVTLKADVTNVVDERHEGNNSKSLRISR